MICLLCEIQHQLLNIFNELSTDIEFSKDLANIVVLLLIDAIWKRSDDILEDNVLIGKISFGEILDVSIRANL
jgi:hypothetical protein